MSMGMCYLCRKPYSRSGMTRHLKVCRSDADAYEPVQEAERRRSTVRPEYFHIAVEGKDRPEYWLHIAIPKDAPLFELDHVLRDIWLECCDHMSRFVIGGVEYLDDECDDVELRDGSRSMDVLLGDALASGARFSYEYDLGATTRLALRVVDAFRFPVAVEPHVYLLARNHEPVIPCACGKGPARHVCSQCMDTRDGWLCEDCAPRHACGEEALLPVVNSPRVGMCAYTGMDDLWLDDENLLDDVDPAAASWLDDDGGFEPEFPRDPFIMERQLRRIHQMMNQTELDSAEDVNAFLQARLMEVEDEGPPEDDPVWQAQELAWQAYQAKPVEARSLARRALKLDPDCADAYVVVGNLAEDAKSAIAQYEMGVAAGKRAIERELGPDAFASEAGHFWGIVSTRPYMRALENLATARWHADQQDEAIRLLRELIRLNPNDNLGVRYTLVNWLLETRRTAEAGRLIAQFGDEPTCHWLYSKALWHYQRSGDSQAARRALADAVEANPHVRRHMALIVREAIEDPDASELSALPETYTLGSPEEAEIYLHESLGAWTASGDAIMWLLSKAKRPESDRSEPRRSEKVGRNDPCPCGSGKKYKKCCGR